MEKTNEKYSAYIQILKEELSLLWDVQNLLL